MLDEFEEVTWSADEAHPRAGKDEQGGAGQELARRLTRAFADANAEFRAQMLERLLLTLGPLALVGVADGAFAHVMDRQRPGRLSLSPEDVWRFSTDQFAALSAFVVQVNPEALRSLVAVTI